MVSCMTWIVDGDVRCHMAEVYASKSLNRVKRIGVRVSPVVKPALVVEADRVHRERIPLPFADGIAEPGRIYDFFGMGAAVGEHLTEARGELVQDERASGSLDDLEAAGNQHHVRNAVGQAGFRRASSSIARHPFLKDFLRPRE